ncbi:protein of unknown function DUF632 [Dillenia turbinata]|uniref:DUF632 domain-containing protein n=1 Tax=Dillenia turbinata TaxID=194707 RepID=A0AAN8YVM3_9MAGN
MGCASSKVDDSQAVVLCKERLNSLNEAINLRYSFAEAHVLYIQSLKDVGFSLHTFFDRDLEGLMISSPSPVLNLPNQRKGDPNPNPNPNPNQIQEDGNGNHHHLHHTFYPDPDSEDDDEDGSLHHSGNSSPLHEIHHHDIEYPDHEALNSYQGGGIMHINYMKHRATPSVTVQMGESSKSSANYYNNPYPYDDGNPSAAYPYYGYVNYGVGGGGGGGGYGAGYYGSPVRQPVESSSKPPPPPPPPPSSSAWDFLNPFETFDRFYPPYTPSRDSREVREEEGIPDLEDEDYQHEVVKEVHGDQKFIGGGGGGGGKFTAKSVDGGADREAPHQGRLSAAVENDSVEYEVHMVDKNGVANEEKSEAKSNMPTFKARGGSLGAAEVVREIQVQFERASECGNELVKMLEVGKQQYHRKGAAYQVSSKMLHVITPSLSVVSSQPSTSKSAEPSSSTEKGSAAFLDFDEEVGMRTGNLSSTLRKLCMWEKKLYDEVKAEEKMRVVHDRKIRRLKRLHERGAEPHKVDATRNLIRTLSTKIRIAIQVVDRISVNISKLRDEELWPQINELIQGLTRMWKAMLECHRAQCTAIKEARILDAIANDRKPSDARIEALWKLEQELVSWTYIFTNWVRTQKGYVRALNEWLLKCLPCEPEDTADGPAPFSPGRMGAPPVFVICNQWSQALDSISEKEVVVAIKVCSTSVLQLWERDKGDVHRLLTANKDMERKVKELERKDQKLHKDIHILEKKLILVSGDGNGLSSSPDVHQSEGGSSLQACLKHIFEAMERFAANTIQAYEQLLQRCEEIRDNAKVS